MGADVAPPLGILAELTHRCPLACPYCSNPLQLTPASDELSTEMWKDVLSQGADIGVLQAHLSGGEPGARRDLRDIVAHCAKIGIYSNLITSGVGWSRDRLEQLFAAGLDHVQLSVQDCEPESADRISGYAGAFAKKQEFAAWMRELGAPLTINAVIHRANVARAGDMAKLAVAWGARRVEIAHTQYYGWALRNRAHLMPTRAQSELAYAEVEALRETYADLIMIDHVIPDYHSRFPKPCMHGWGARFLNVAPNGDVAPCHGAHSLPNISFWSVKDRALQEIWSQSPAFNLYRGDDWMQAPCRSCERKTIDFGGCRCQAFALLGDAAATDPACSLSPEHRLIVELGEKESADGNDLNYWHRR